MEIYKPGAMIGQYEVASLPMKGGMGVVYFCLDHRNDKKPVALKTFRPEFLPNREARDRFLREGTAWVNLGSHPHIVRCHRVEYIDPTAFLVLELIAREQGMEDASLRSWMGSPMKVEQALLFALQIARGLQHATTKIPGFVHRDLKPENVLVGADKLPDTNVNWLRVTDFGLATTLKKDEGGRQAEEDGAIGRTHLTHGVVGTPLYMAPEQWKGEEVGVYTDVYALGCILYEMLTGKRAVSGRSIGELRSAHCSGKLSTLPEALPRELKSLIKRCMALRSDERYQEWGMATQELEKIYTILSGMGVPDKLAMGQFNREERVQEMWSYNAMGNAYFHMGKMEVSKAYTEKALTISRDIGNRHGEGTFLNNLGLVNEALGNPQQAIVHYNQSLVIAREIGERFVESHALGNIGSAYKVMNDARRAIEYYEQDLAITRDMGNRRGESAVLGNLGNIYLNLGDTHRAIKCYEKQMQISREIGNRRGEGHALGNLGDAYRILGDIRQALVYFEQSISISREIGDRRSECTSLGNQGAAYLVLGDVQQAIKSYEQSLVITREIGDLNAVASVCFNIAILYSQQGNTTDALTFAQESARDFEQVGNMNYAKRAIQLAEQLESILPAPNWPADLAQAAFDAFQFSGNIGALKLAVRQYPLLKDPQFIQAIQVIIKERVPIQSKSDFEKKLEWLKQIALEK
jgi:tetratricopeptide (TPR) repeat protein